MSRLLRTVELKISTIRFPGGWKDRLDVANVAGLADQLRAGVSLPPVKVTHTHQLVAGAHRIAAHLEVGLPAVRCDVIEYATPEEIEEDTICENIRRRTLSTEERDRGLARLVAIAQGRGTKETISDTIARLHQQAIDEAGIGPGLVALEEAHEAQLVARAAEIVSKAAATAEVASKTGHSQRTIERAVAKQEAADEPSPPAALADTIKSFGLPVMLNVREDAVRWQAAIDEADGLLRRAQAALSRLVDVTKVNSILAKAVSEAHQAAQHARKLRPDAVCAWCKMLSELDCKACSGRGWRTSDQTKLPPELELEGDQAMVCVGPGAFMLRTEYMRQKAPAARPAKPGKKIKVVDEKGADLVPPDDEGLAF